MSQSLETEACIDGPDDLYQELVALHRGLDVEERHVVDARLILLLANHIGDPAVVREAIARSRNPRVSE